VVTVFTIPYTRIEAKSSPAFPDQSAVYLPTLRGRLVYKDEQRAKDLLFLIDSGSDNCIFSANVGYQIGIDIKSGPVGQPMLGSTGQGIAYYHHVTVLLNFAEAKYRPFNVYAGFVEGIDSIGVLGRNGFFTACNSVLFEEDKRRVHVELEDATTSSPTEP
jgi:hypothetical protein